MIRTAALLLTVSMFAPAIARAQSPGYVSNNNRTGAPDFGSFLNADIDSVNLSNGGLTINLPLVERSARGASFAVGMQYNSKSWFVVPYSGPCSYPYEADTCTYYVWQSAGNAWQTEQQPSTGSLNYDEQAYSCDTFRDGEAQGDPQVRLMVYSNFIWTAPDGTQYQFPNRVMATLPGFDACILDDGDGNNATTIDGFGENLVGTSDSGEMKLTVTKTGDAYGSITSTLIGRDGRTINGATTEDAQGNICCGTSGAWTTDFMNRPVVGTGPGTLQYYDAGGTARTISISYTSPTTVTPSFPTSTCGSIFCIFDTDPTPVWGLQTVTLANGLQYSFSYGGLDIDGSANVFGEVTGVTLPNGGSIAYKWQTLPGFDSGPVDPVNGDIYLDARVVAERDVNDGAGHVAVWKYNYLPSGISGTVVTDPVGDDTVHTFGAPCDTLGYTPALLLETQTESFTGSYLSGSRLQKTQTTWDCDIGPVITEQPGYNIPNSGIVPDYADPPTTEGPRNPRVTAVTTTLEDVSPNQVRSTTTNYGAGTSYSFNTAGDVPGLTFYDNESNPVTVTEADWGSGSPGAPLRITNNTYTDYGSQHILGLLTQKQITDGASNQLALTNFHYDTTALATTSGAAAGHDYINYGSGFNLRGNLTETDEWISGTTFATSLTYYNDLGELIESVDPNTNPTYYGYTDSWANTACTPSSGSGLAYVTSVTNALGQVTARTANSCDGSLATETDPNSQTWNWSWDGMGRLRQSGFPDGGLTTYLYNDIAGNYGVQTQRLISPGGSCATTFGTDATACTDSFVFFDGLGRPTLRSSANSETIPWDQALTQYDLMGRKLFASYPCQATSATSSSCSPSTTFNGDTFGYDALSRPALTTHVDGTTFITSYAGRATETQDEGNGSNRITKVKQTNGLNQLTTVCEVTSVIDIAGNAPAACGLDFIPSPATGFLTNYQFDALGNILQVAQGGLQNRNFLYDGLSRLTCAANPEAGAASSACTAGGSTTGAVTYTFDANSNALTRTRPAPNQTNPSTTLTTSYTWDALNRLTNTSYSDGESSIGRSYDDTYFSNAIGRLTWISSATTVDGLYYDAMGRVNQEGGCTPRMCGWTGYNQQYSFDLIGDETTALMQNDFWGHPYDTLTTAYNRASRPIAVSSASGGLLASGATHNARGETSLIPLGNGLVESRTYDARGRTTGIVTDSVYSYTGVVYAPNGDLMAANDSANNNYYYSFDDLNRLKQFCSPDCDGTTAVYGYDRNGNRWTSASPPLSFTGGNNRVDGYAYDATGNLLNDGAHSYTYDAESRVIAVDGGTTASYIYDVFGRRVQAMVGGVMSEYLYEPSGHEIVINSGQAPTQEEVAFAGRNLATLADGGVFYVHPDPLGTVRVRSNSSGSAVETDTSGPFGEPQSIGNAISKHHFTGKLDDTETGLAYFGARYYNSSLGRFLTPDPTNMGVDFENPQTWNRYAYALNNPVSMVDQNGLWPTWIHNYIIGWAFGDTIEAPYGGLNDHQIALLKAVSAAQDHCAGCQGTDASFTRMHAMAGTDASGNYESAAQAQSEYTNYVGGEVAAAQLAEARFLAAGGTGYSDEALTHFARALHAEEDNTSPAHQGFQQWHGLSAVLPFAVHIVRESWISSDQLMNSISVARGLFDQTFGRDQDYIALERINLLAEQEPEIPVGTVTVTQQANRNCNPCSNQKP